MASRLIGTRPLLEPMLVYCQMDAWEQVSVKFKSESYHFHSRKKCLLPKWRPFHPGGGGGGGGELSNKIGCVFNEPG